MSIPSTPSHSPCVSRVLRHHQILHMQAHLILITPGPSEPTVTDVLFLLQSFTRDDSPTPGPVYGPEDPFNPYTEIGRAFIERRDSGDFPTIVDQWIQANMCAWNQDDPRMLSTEMMPDKIKCTIEVVHFPVRFLILIYETRSLIIFHAGNGPDFR